MAFTVPAIPASIQRAMPACGNNLVLDPAFHNAAVERCCQAWMTVYKAERLRGTPGISCYLRANEAYRYAMPPLTTGKNIRDYIACCAHGMMARTIDMIVAPHLLAAARIACRARQCELLHKREALKDASKPRKTRSRSGSGVPGPAQQ